ncbi:amidase family protein [Parasalinivibrio latis]|uniref:amidase family protein n=1 Tax=Parasalinivibrio latis TaxID=2952610 RepID=UPI0030DEE929
MLLFRNALVEHAEMTRQDTRNGTLTNVEFVVSDHVAVTGYKTGIGIPEYLSDQSEASEDAVLVSALLENGATCVGKTQVDEFVFCSRGINDKMKDLKNPSALKHWVGGPGSGVAVAVAGGIANVGVGNDSFGGIRTSAALCGLFGFRPTKDSMDKRGFKTFTQSFDIPGFMSNNISLIDILQNKFSKLTPSIAAIQKVKVASNLFKDFLSEDHFSKVKIVLEGLPFSVENTMSLNKMLTVQAYDTYHKLAGRELLMELGEWLDANNIAFHPQTASRIDWYKSLTFKDQVEGNKKRQIITANLLSVFAEDEVLLFPTTPGPAPHNDIGEKEAEEYNDKLSALVSVAELTGCPQLTMPLFKVDGVPLGVSMLAHPGKDKCLMQAAMRILQSADFPVALASADAVNEEPEPTEEEGMTNQEANQG